MGEARELAVQVWEAIESDHLDHLGDLFDNDAELSTTAGSGKGQKYITELFTRHHQGYPDLRHEVLDSIESADGRAVALRIMFTGTHLGTLRGPFGPIPATGRSLRWWTSDHVRTMNGKIISWHAHFDRLTVAQQLGLIPSSPPDKTHPAAANGATSNKAIIRRILTEVFTHGRADLLDEILTPDFVNHRVPPGLDSGIGSVKRIVALERHAFPDLTYTIEHEVAEGDLVMSVSLAEGTHEGTIFGVAPTGRRVSWRQVHIARIRDGQMAEHWGVSDLASLWVQIGRAAPIGTVHPSA